MAALTVEDGMEGIVANRGDITNPGGVIAELV
jgi:hypothetical protein